MEDLRQKLKNMEQALNIIQQVPCSAEEENSFAKMIKAKQALPDDVKEWTDGTHYRLAESDLTDNEKQKYALYSQTLYIKSIRDIMIFFIALVIITLILLFIRL